MKNDLKLYVGISILMLVDLFLYLTFGISIAGELSDQIIFWLWFIGTFYIVFKFIRKKWARIYGTLLLILVLLSLFPMGVPFLTIAAFAIEKEHSVKVNHEIRVCTTSKSVIGRPYLSIIKNYWVLEKEIGGIGIDELEIDNLIYDFDDVKSISRLSESPDEKVCLEFEFDDGKTLSNCIKPLPVN